MAQYYNPTPGARGINLKDGTVRLVEAGQSVEIDAGEVIAAHPDIKTDAKQGEKQAEPGPLDGSVDDLIKYLETIDDADEVQKLIDAETAGKSRKGAITALEARRDAILAA